MQDFDNDDPKESHGRRREYSNRDYDEGGGRDYNRGRSRDYDRGRGRHNYGMDRDDDYHSRDGSPSMEHTNHMGMDHDGSIGTGV